MNLVGSLPRGKGLADTSIANRRVLMNEQRQESTPLPAGLARQTRCGASGSNEGSTPVSLVFVIQTRVIAKTQVSSRSYRTISLDRKTNSAKRPNADKLESNN
eukprot:190012-Amphidinium_carterae.1